MAVFVPSPHKPADGAALGEGGVQHGLLPPGQQLRLPGQGGEQGPGQQLEGGEGGEGVARQGQDGLAPIPGEHGRGARLQPQLPEHPLRPQQGQGLVEDVLVPHRHPAGGDHQVTGLQHPRHGLRHRPGVVPGQLAGDVLHPQLPQAGEQQGQVGPVDLSNRQGADAGLHHLVPGGQHPNPGPPAHRHLRDTGGGEHPHRRRVHPAPGRQQAGPRPVVLPPVHIVVPGPQRCVDLHHRGAHVRVLLLQHAVAAGRQHGPRHHPYRLPRRHGHPGRVSGIERVRHGEEHRVLPAGPGRVRRTQGVPVQRGAVKGRLIHGRGDLLRQPPPRRLRQGQLFCPQAVDIFTQRLLCLLQRQSGSHACSLLQMVGAAIKKGAPPKKAAPPRGQNFPRSGAAPFQTRKVRAFPLWPRRNRHSYRLQALPLGAVILLPLL